MSSADGLEADPFSVTVVPSGVEAGADEMDAVGATPAAVAVKFVVALSPWPSSAVMVIVWLEASSRAGRVQDHTPLLVPVLVTVPADAVMATVSPSGSEKLPVFASAVPSLTVTVEVSADTVGAWLRLPATTHVSKAKSRPHRTPDSQRTVVLLKLR